MYAIVLLVGLSIYTALYYIIVLNRYFDGVEGKMLKESLFIKKLIRNVFLIILCVAAMTVLNTQNILYGKILSYC